MEAASMALAQQVLAYLLLRWTAFCYVRRCSPNLSWLNFHLILEKFMELVQFEHGDAFVGMIT